MIAKTFDFTKEENIKFQGDYCEGVLIGDDIEIDEVELLLKKFDLLLKKYPNALNKGEIIKTYNMLKDYSKRNRVSLRDCYSYYDTDDGLIEKNYRFNVNDYYHESYDLNSINKYGIRMVPTIYQGQFDVNITKYSMTSDKRFEGKSQLNLSLNTFYGLSLLYKNAIIESSDIDYTMYYDSTKLDELQDMYYDEDRFLIEDLNDCIRRKSYCKSKTNKKRKKNQNKYCQRH